MSRPAHLDTRSVLFTDLVGSTELRSRLGDRRADELRRDHDGLLASTVHAHQGTVIKGLGDGILASFRSGADAVAAAVAIQQAIERLRRTDPESTLSVRVGISAGDVSVEDGDLFGTPVVEASRLCAVAIGGEILVSDVVRTLARGRAQAAFEPVGDLELKGLREPLPACRVTWAALEETAGPLPLPPMLVAGAPTVYVGRSHLLERLREAWSATANGGCRTVLLAGEPGVGKTRTAAELAKALHAEGALVLYGRCEEGLGVPYQPFAEALGYYADKVTSPLLGRLPGELTRLLPELGERVPDLPPPVASDPRVEEYRLLEAVGSWLDAAAQPAGLVLVIDDLHWATKPTLLMLAHLVRMGAGVEGASRLLVLATFRDTDVDRGHPLWEVSGDLRRLAGVERISLRGLTEGEVMELLTAAAGHELDADARTLSRTLHEETEGNPFFIVEVMRHLIETGGVRREGERWVVADPEHVSLPEGVRDVVGRRLSRLSDSANTALSVAAVLGRDWEMDVVMAVTRLDEAVLLDGVDEALRARLVEETGADRFHFAHALVQETLYGELSATRCRRLHRRVAEALEGLRPGDVVALSYHWIKAGPQRGDLSRAIHCTLAAAQQAQDSRALALAEARYRQVLDLVEEAGQPHTGIVLDTMIGLGECQRDQSNTTYRDTLLAAADRAGSQADTRRLVRAVLANWRAFASIVGDVDRDRLAVAEAALSAVGEDPSPERARLLAYLSSEMTFTGENVRRLALVEEAEMLARRLGDDRLLAEVLIRTGLAADSAERAAELLRRTDEAVRLADASGDPSLQVESRFWWSAARLRSGEMRAARGAAEEAVAIAKKECSPTLQWMARSCCICHVIASGRLDDADRENDECLALAESTGEPDRLNWWGTMRLASAFVRGTEGELADLAGAAAEQYPALPAWWVAHAVALAGAGRLDEARQTLDLHPFDLRKLAGAPFEMFTAGVLGIVAWRLRDRARANAVAQSLQRRPSDWLHTPLTPIGPTRWVLGLCSVTLGRLDDGIIELDAAVAEAEREECPAIATIIRLDLASALLERRSTGDVERARSLLITVDDAAAGTGATGLRERVQGLQRSGG